MFCQLVLGLEGYTRRVCDPDTFTSKILLQFYRICRKYMGTHKWCLTGDRLFFEALNKIRHATHNPMFTGIPPALCISMKMTYIRTTSVLSIWIRPPTGSDLTRNLSRVIIMRMWLLQIYRDNNQPRNVRLATIILISNPAGGPEQISASFKSYSAPLYNPQCDKRALVMALGYNLIISPWHS